MKYADRRRYKVWLHAVLEKESLSPDEIIQVIGGQLLLPAQEIDGGLLKECFAALETPASESMYAHEEETWTRIRQDIVNRKRLFPALHRRTRLAVLVLLVLLLFALTAAAIAAAFGYHIFAFPFPTDHPYSYVQDGAYDLTRHTLARAHYGHVDVEVREAIYDGKELRVVYSIRDRNTTSPLSEADKYHSLNAATLDGILSCCDWIEIGDQNAFLSDVAEEPGEMPGEMLYSLQVLLTEQDIIPEGVFTVGLPLLKNAQGCSVAPPELTFTLNAEDAKKWVRTAAPAELTVGNIHIALTEAEFSPLSGAILLVITDESYDPASATDIWVPNNGGDGVRSGEKSSPAEVEAYKWGEKAQIFAMDGTQAGLVQVEYWSYREGPGILPTKLRITPPKGDGWPEEMILAICDENGKPDSQRQIPIRLK